VCDVEAHGDGVSQVAVDSMDFCVGMRCLASVGEGRNSIRLWDVHETGMALLRYPALVSLKGLPIGQLHPRPAGEILPEYSVPRFVGLANNATELVIGYLEQAIM
jgi:hypothetical protein